MSHAVTTMESTDFSTLAGPVGTSAHDRILNTACRLFYRHGVNSVGIDRIIAESGVAKMSLYRNFGSKSALVETYLKHRDACWKDVFQRYVLNLDRPPKEKILAYFDLMHQWLNTPGFHGCAYINAAAEHLDPEGIAAIVQQHKRHNLELLRTLVEQAGIDNFTELAEQLFLLSEGALVTAAMSGNLEAMRSARKAAAKLLDSCQS